MRLIDADELMIHYKGICELCGKYKENNGAMCRCCYLDDAISFLEDMQEIEELPTAEWIIGSYEVKCSHCEYLVWGSGLNAYKEWKFCPNCGKQMKGDTE